MAICALCGREVADEKLQFAGACPELEVHDDPKDCRPQEVVASEPTTPSVYIRTPEQEWEDMAAG